MAKAERVLRGSSLALAAWAFVACGKSSPPAPPSNSETTSKISEHGTGPSAPAAAPVAAVPPRPAPPLPPRLVAIGDLHGDLGAARRALRLAGAIDEKDHWSGGKLVIVQTGDEIDRGDDDRAILDLFDRLSEEAAAAGGQVVPLLGNHEVMNAALDFRYVTDGAFRAFSSLAPGHAHDDLEPAARPRATAFAPGGIYAKLLAKRSVSTRFGGTLFVHGGILPKHVKYGLDRIDSEAHAWLLGGTGAPPKVLTAEDGPLWTRMYSAAPGAEECKILKEMLEEAKADRLVMGHTVQRNGINAACDGAAWRIDVGMAQAFGGPIQVLEITAAGAKKLEEGTGK